jgi:hypothetical protein
MIVSTLPPDLSECVRLMHFREIFVRFKRIGLATPFPIGNRERSVVKYSSAPLMRDPAPILTLGRTPIFTFASNQVGLPPQACSAKPKKTAFLVKS